MKRITVLALAIAMICLPSCKNNKKTTTDTTAAELASKEQIAEATLSVDVQNLMESAKKIKAAPFVSASKDGRINLTAKEKMVKPDYLLNPAAASKLVTLSQKYRYTSMLATDLVIANLYEMNTNDIREAIAKLLVDINDNGFTDFANTPWEDLEGASDAMKFLVEEEYEAGRETYYWEAVAASLVEQIYIVTRNIDKFMPMFTDEAAADVTYNFVCVHDGLTSLVQQNEEMASLNEALAPLYVINAISTQQLKDQLTSLKSDIEKARLAILK